MQLLIVNLVVLKYNILNIQTSPSCLVSEFSSTFSYFLQGQYKEAKHHYELVLKKEPSNDLIRQNLVKLERAAAKRGVIQSVSLCIKLKFLFPYHYEKARQK